MSNKLLLQEEIDALLGKLNKAQDSPKPPPQDDRIIQISSNFMDQVEKNFAVILNTKINAVGPRIENYGEKPPPGLVFPLVAGKGVLAGGFTDQTVFLLKNADASKLAAAFMGDTAAAPENELSEDVLGVVSEVFNQVNLIFGDILNGETDQETSVEPQAPAIVQKEDELRLLLENDRPSRLITYELRVGEDLAVELYHLLGFKLAEVLSPPERAQNSEIQKYSGSSVYPAGDASAPPAAGNIQMVLGNSMEKNKLNLILEIPLKVSVVLGKTRVPIKKVLELTTGSLVELSSKVSEPVDVLVNGTLVAKGEVIVVNENFGVRINSIISPEERIKYLEG